MRTPPIPPLDAGTVIANRSATLGRTDVEGTIDGTPFHLRSRRGQFVLGVGSEAENDPAFRLSRPHFPVPADIRWPTPDEMDRALAQGVHHFRQWRRHHYQESQRAKLLWCVNVLGPDDVHAAENFEHAVWLCNQHNQFNSAINKAEHDILLLAIVIPWPWDREAHAADLIKTREMFGPKAVAGS
ncbi:hypothetical protein EOD42_22215 [Rhodovarius crocodyli]|uniref:Uncharacterized protein n=1 Tax=Rhodovarius crocodyli TaxID=1979269 RepID=A0A437M185_9PROT|nr:hypothetical protein [Rhodovarius crocodyli]RVT91372.1 hypothetical protein EOD42_22215 [Rhodovarius crocodyli]